MGVVIRQSFKSVVVQYLGIIIGYINIVWLFPKCLPLDQIGLVRFILEMGFLLACFAQIGVPNAINKFYPYFRDPENNDHGFQFWMSAIPVVGIVLFSIIFILIRPLFISSFQENSPLVLDYYWYFIPFTIIYVYLNITEQYCSTQLRIVVPRIIRDVYLRAGTSLVLIMSFVGWLSFDQLMVGLVILYFSALAVNIYYIHLLKGINLKPDFGIMKDKALRKQIIYFLGFIIIVGIGSTIVTKIDSYMISSLIDLSNFTVYSTALFIATVIEMPYRSISQISMPIVADAMKDKDMVKLDSIYKKSSINQTILGIFIFLLIWINTDNIFEMMPNGHEFKGGKYVILFIGLSKLFDLLTGVNAAIIANSKFYYYGIYFMFLLTGLAITLNYLLIPSYGIVGVGIATAVSILVYNILITVMLRIKIGLQPFTGKTVILLGVGIAMFLVNMALPDLKNIYLDIAYRSTLILGAYSLATYILNISPEMNNTVGALVSRIRSGRLL